MARNAGGVRAHRHHRAALARQHDFGDGAGDAEHTLGVDVEHPVPFGVAGLDDKLVGQHARDIGGEIDRAPIALDAGDQRINLRAVTHVERLRVHAFPELGRDRGNAQVGRHHLRAFLMKAAHQSEAYASARAGDDGDLAPDAAVAHGSVSLLSAASSARASIGAMAMVASWPVRKACSEAMSETSTRAA